MKTLIRPSLLALAGLLVLGASAAYLKTGRTTSSVVLRDGLTDNFDGNLNKFLSKDQDSGSIGVGGVVVQTQHGNGSALDALNMAKVGMAAMFMPIKPGEFDMTDRVRLISGIKEFKHHVKLTKSFELQATEVTQLQYVLVTGSNPSTFRKEENCDPNNFDAIHGKGLCLNHPVENVDWEDTRKFIKKLNDLQNQCTYRLPTEAEWRYAAASGMPMKESFYTGTFKESYSFLSPYDINELDQYAWHGGNSNKRTRAVGTKKPNAWGLFDMYGNVWEMSQDWYRDPNSDMAEPPAAVDPLGPKGGFYKTRLGGSWDFSAAAVTDKGTMEPGRYRLDDTGFRLARSCR